MVTHCAGGAVSGVRFSPPRLKREYTMDDFDQNDIPIISKPNRRKKLEPKTHSSIIGPPPPTGVHSLSRKEKEKLTKKITNELLKKS